MYMYFVCAQIGWRPMKRLSRVSSAPLRYGRLFRMKAAYIKASPHREPGADAARSMARVISQRLRVRADVPLGDGVHRRSVRRGECLPDAVTAAEFDDAQVRLLFEVRSAVGVQGRDGVVVGEVRLQVLIDLDSPKTS